MAKLDNSIYFNQPDILGGFERGMQMRQAMDQKKRQQDLSSAMNEGIVTNPDGTKLYDHKRGYDSLVGKGFVSEAEDLRAKDLAQQQTKQKMTFDKVNQIAQLYDSGLQNVGDQKTYDMFLRQAKELGGDTSVMDPQWGPNAQKQMKFYAGQAYKTKDRLELQKLQAEIGKTQAEAAKARSEAGSPGTVKMTEAQSKSLGFGRRAMLADQMLEKITSDPNADVTSLKTQMKSALPKWLGGAKSPQEQSLNTAKLAFISAVLRKESGAAVTPEEFQTYDRQFFPQPGDTPESLSEKKVLRANFIDTEKLTAGNAWRDPVQPQTTAKKSTTDNLDNLSDAELEALYMKAKGGK